MLLCLFCDSKFLSLSFTDQITETLFFKDKSRIIEFIIFIVIHRNHKIHNKTAANKTETRDTHPQCLNVCVSAAFIPLFESALFYSVFTLLVFTNTNSLRFHSEPSARDTRARTKPRPLTARDMSRRRESACCWCPREKGGLGFVC